MQYKLQWINFATSSFTAFHSCSLASDKISGQVVNLVLTTNLEEFDRSPGFTHLFDLTDLACWLVQTKLFARRETTVSKHVGYIHFE